MRVIGTLLAALVAGAAAHAELDPLARRKGLGSSNHDGPLENGMKLKGGHMCGHAIPGFHEDLEEPLTVAQAYPVKTRRQLAENVHQTYPLDASNDFLPLSQATADQKRKIKIEVTWDFINGGGYYDAASNPTADTNYQHRQCSGTDTSDVKAYNGEAYPEGLSACEESEMIVLPSPITDEPDYSTLYGVMKNRTEYAVQYWQSVLTVKNTTDDIVVHADIVARYNLGQNTFSGVDLVVIMAAQPANAAIAGFALCLQRDQHHRCTVGLFNWIPKIFDVANRDSADTLESERHTALHEMAHIFGAVQIGDHFIDDSGNARDWTELYEEENDGTDYAKPVTKVKTTKVLEKAREMYDCPELGTEAGLMGIPLEDYSVGALAHWEARVLGPEFMSYGSSSGEVYISDLTLAFLEDTNQYEVDYSMAGPLVVYEENDAELSSLSFLQENGGNPVTTDEVDNVSPGYARWGRHAGCDFLRRNPVNWASATKSRYTCTTHRDYMCTADNRMSAVCQLTVATGASDFSFGSGTASGGILYKGSATTNPDAPDLPSMYRYFGEGSGFLASAGANDANRLAGFSQSMDYVPIPVGYWNCAHQQASTSADGRSGEEGATVNATEFGSQEDIDLFGGQEQCPECRCFTSSLLEWTKGVNPQFQKYGLCYRSNCYQEDGETNLQVAVKGVFSTTINWYACPAAGGKLQIPGYTGSLHCPSAEEFCNFENFNTVKYPETNLLLQQIFWYTISGIVILCILVCLTPCLRDKLITCFKWRCGVLTFDEFADEYKRGDLPEDAMVLQVPDPKWGRVLMFMNFVTFLFGGALVGLSAYAWQEKGFAVRFLVPFVILGVAAFSLGSMGIIGSRKAARGTSCVLIFYAVLSMISLVGMAWAGLYFSSWDGVEDYVTNNWAEVCQLKRFDDCTSYPTDDQYDQSVDTLSMMRNNTVVITAITCVWILMGLIVDIRLMEWAIFIGFSYTVVNNLVAIIGVFLLAGGSFIYATQKTDGCDDLPNLVNVAAGLLIATGVYMFGQAFVALGAERARSQKRLTIALLAQVVGFLLMVSTSAASLTQADRAVDKITDFSEDQIEACVHSYGFNMDRQELIETVTETARALGLFAAVFSAVMFFQVTLCYFFKVELRRWNATHQGVQEGAQDVKAAGKALANAAGANPMYN